MTDVEMRVKPVRAGRGGRDRKRRAEAATPAYIRRQIPTYDIAPEEALLRIEETADRILAEIGLDVRDDPEALELFRKAGAKIEDVRCRLRVYSLL